MVPPVWTGLRCGPQPRSAQHQSDIAQPDQTVKQKQMTSRVTASHLLSGLGLLGFVSLLFACLARVQLAGLDSWYIFQFLMRARE